MRYRDFGTTGISVSEIGVGCSRIGGVFSDGSSRKEELAFLHAALDAGINLFDTADTYAQGQSELLVGKALRRRRDAAVIATKAGYVVPAGRRILSTLKPALRPVVVALRIKRPASLAPIGGAARQDFTPDYLVGAVEASLRRLGTDYIDIYQLHSPPRSVVDAGEYVAVLQRLQDQGKIRCFGIAADGPDDVAGFDRHPEIRSLQAPLSLLEPAAVALFARASELGVGGIGRSCFAAGLLNEKLSDEQLRAATPDWERVLALRRLAHTLGRPLLELAVQFSIRAPLAVTIVGMRTRAHLESNLRFYAAPSLTADDVEAIAGST